MKLNTKKVKKVNKLPSLKSRSVGIGNQKKVIEVATKGLYSQPIRTAVQEHISNAKDSHDEAGVCLSKISITAPTLASMELVIKDCGLGMSEKEVFENYTQLGVSTKDSSNDFLGAFGYGALSWFAVSPSFSLTTIKDGVKCVFLVAKDDVEFAKVDLLSKKKTKESNGVELKLPINDKKEVKKVQDAINRSLRFWTQKPVLKNMDIETLVPNFFGENGIIYNHKENPSLKKYPVFILSFGGIEYFLDNESLDALQDTEILCGYDNEHTVVLNVALGEIEVPPDRERILVNDKSLNLLKKRLKSLQDETQKEIHKDITKDWSRVEHWRRLNDIYLIEDFPVYQKDGLEVEASVHNSSLTFEKIANKTSITNYRKNDRGHLEQYVGSMVKNIPGPSNLNYFINDEDIRPSSYKKRLKTLNQSVFQVIENQRPFSKTQKEFLEKQGFSFKNISSIKEPKISQKTQGRSQVQSLSCRGFTSTVIKIQNLDFKKMVVVPEIVFSKHKNATHYMVRHGKHSHIAVIKDKDLFLFAESKKISESQVINFFKSKEMQDSYDFELSYNSLSQKDRMIIKEFNLFHKLCPHKGLNSRQMEKLKEIPFMKGNLQNQKNFISKIKKVIKEKEKVIERKIISNLVYSQLVESKCKIPFHDLVDSYVGKKALKCLKTTSFTKLYLELLEIDEIGCEYSNFNSFASKAQKSQATAIVSKMEKTFKKIEKKRPMILSSVISFLREELNRNGTIKKNAIKEIDELLVLLDKP